MAGLLQSLLGYHPPKPPLPQDSTAPANPYVAALQNASGSTPSPAPTETPPPDIWAQARQQFPILNNPNLLFKRTPRPESNFNYLETWPPGEEGATSAPRPREFPLNKYGVEVYKNSTTPLMVIGDAVSHMLRFTDPTVKQYYSNFQQSLTPKQKAMLQRQYQNMVRDHGEHRSYSEWEQMSGLPQLFGGYAFKEWPNAQQYYTPDQIKQFDAMMQYLRTGKPSP